jgi:hypothetical protein
MGDGPFRHISTSKSRLSFGQTARKFTFDTFLFVPDRNWKTYGKHDGIEEAQHEHMMQD